MRDLIKKYQVCYDANEAKVRRVKTAWHRLILNYIVHTRELITFWLT